MGEEEELSNIDKNNEEDERELITRAEGGEEGEEGGEDDSSGSDSALVKVSGIAEEGGNENDGVSVVCSFFLFLFVGSCCGFVDGTFGFFFPLLLAEICCF